jgi:hypothetical protein
MSTQPFNNGAMNLGALSKPGRATGVQPSRPAIHSTFDPFAADDPYANVPLDMKQDPRWVTWCKIKRNGKETKFPYDARTGECAKSNDSATWCDFETAVQVFNGGGCSVYGDKYAGIGFMLGDGYGGTDFDSVLGNDFDTAYMRTALELLGNPYSEISPSGMGVKGIYRSGGEKFESPKDKKRPHYGIDTYANGRFFTVTGDTFAGSGLPKVDADTMGILRLLSSQFLDEEFKKLWTGNASAYAKDSSGSGLVFNLARVLRNLLKTRDRVLIERYLAASPLAQNEHWTDERQRNMVFEKLLNDTTASSDDIGADRSEPLAESQKYKLDFKFPVSTNQSDSEFVMAPVEGDDGWFPLGAVSLVGGKSGSGKTTTMYQALTMQGMKIPFFDSVFRSSHFRTFVPCHGCG